MKNNFKMKTALTIAGSDSIGGAGIQADIKTMCCLGVYAMSAVTALTAQNTTAVKSIAETDSDFLDLQLDCIFEDIFPDAIKTGMISNPKQIKVISDKLTKYDAQNIVVDPVMMSTSGSKLASNNAVTSAKERLFPIADLITPNIPEAEILSDTKISSRNDMEKAVKIISLKYGCSVLCKGGHSLNNADDILFHDGYIIWYKAEKVYNSNAHGTGCTLSSAIASYLALGETLEESVRKAKKYITGALRAGLDLGKGNGPLAHNYKMTERSE